jgi:hypothetical protein
MKERIGDALRNAAMRFGAALDLWHKGDLHGDAEPDDAVTESAKTVDAPAPAPRRAQAKAPPTLAQLKAALPKTVNLEQVHNIRAVFSRAGYKDPEFLQAIGERGRLLQDLVARYRRELKKYRDLDPMPDDSCLLAEGRNCVSLFFGSDALDQANYESLIPGTTDMVAINDLDKASCDAAVAVLLKGAG